MEKQKDSLVVSLNKKLIKKAKNMDIYYYCPDCEKCILDPQSELKFLESDISAVSSDGITLESIYVHNNKNCKNELRKIPLHEYKEKLECELNKLESESLHTIEAFSAGNQHNVIDGAHTYTKEDRLRAERIVAIRKKLSELN